MDNVQERELHLRDYLRIVQKRLWTVATFFIIVVTLVTISVFRQEPVYQATTRLEIERENPNVLSFKEVMEVDTSRDDYYQTQYKLLQSRSLALEVIKKLKLAEHPEFVAVEGNGASAKANGPRPTGEEAAASKLIDAFLKRLDVSPLRNTRLVDINVRSRFPSLAAEMANAMAASFIDRGLNLRRSTTRDATDWLSGQMEDARRKAEASENALQSYKEATGIISISDREDVAAQRLNELTSALTKAKTERIDKESSYNQYKKVAANPDLLDTLPEVMANPLIQEMKKDLTQNQNELSEVSKTYTPKHPKIVSLKTKIEAMESRLKVEVGKITRSIKSEYETAHAREKSLLEAMEQQKNEVQSVRQKAIRMGVLEREVENNRRIYGMLLSRAKETSLAEGITGGNIRVVDQAEIPQTPIKPNKTQSIALAVIVGLMGGLGLAFFFEYLDDSIKDPDDVEERLKLPFLAPVPIIESKGNNSSYEMAVYKEPKSSVAESFRTARTNIAFSTPDKPPKTLLVTSAGPGEGKTTTAVNLAITLALAGSRTLLVDTDLRKPRIHKILKLEDPLGLTNLLTETNDIGRALVRTEIPNLSFIPSGPVPPNPAELLGSERMKKLVAALGGGFDYVVFDGAPVIAVTDATLLATMVDGVILVIRSGATSRRIAARSKKQLEDVHARVIGALLNFVNIKKSQYYYSPYYYYSYYGDDHRKKKAKKKTA